MISLNYINGYGCDLPAFDPFNVLESDINNIISDLAVAYNEYKEAVSEYNMGIEFFEEADEDKKTEATEKKTNFVDKIGKAVIEIGKKAVAFINNIIKKIQESTFANKSDLQKIAALCKQNPDMKDSINEAFKSGNLQVADLKSISELEKAYDEVMKLSRQQDIDPETLEGKWNSAKKKFGNMDQDDIIKGVITASTAITAIASIPTAISTIATIKAKIIKANADAVQSVNRANGRATLTARGLGMRVESTEDLDEFEVSLEYDENGLIIESSGSDITSIVNTVHREMLKVYTVISMFNFKAINKAQAIINSAVKGFNKPVKNATPKEDDTTEKNEE